jgi:hypothetical protein
MDFSQNQQSLIVKSVNKASAWANEKLKKGKPAVEDLFKKEWPVTTWAEGLTQ